MKTKANALIPKDLGQESFQGHSMAWVATLTLILLGFLLPAQGQGDPKLTNTNNPMDTNVSMGATVSFRVDATSTNGPMTRQWQHEGTNLPSATNVTLVITNVTVAHAGGYVAWITNASGAFTNTRTATLTVDPTFIKMDIDKGPNDMWIPYWVDLDRDGWLELVVGGGWGTAGGKPLMVFENNRDGTLRRDLTNDLAKVSIRGANIAWADFDNDNDLDGFAGAFESERPVFLRNDGGGRFTKVVTDRWWTANGIAPYGTLASSVDLDDDGTLDVLVGYFGNLATGTYGTNAVLHGLGNGRFEVDLTSPLALSGTWVEQYDWADWDGDGKLDLFGATSGGDPPVDLMFQNLGGGQFQQVTDNLLVQIQDVSINSAWGDYDNDGDLDLLVTSRSTTNQLYRNLGNGVFEPDPASPVFPANQARCMAAWGDYDNDGWLDLYVAHGDRAGRLFHNRGNGTFEEVTTGSPVSECRAYSCAWGDYDNDGFLDLCGTRDVDGSNYLYRNNLRQVGNTNHWLKVKLVGTASNRDGIGATIRIKTTVAGKELWQMRQIVCQSHGAELIAHFGLGDATTVDLLRIQWPSGNVQEVGGVIPDRMVSLTEPIRINPLRPTASLNGSVTLTNVSIGVSYQWFHDGTNLVGQTARTLTLSNLAAADAGLYSVAVGLGNGITLTNYTYLKVNSTFTKITEGPVVIDKANFFNGTWADYDGDGFVDLLVPAGPDVLNQAPALYHNLGGTNFVKMTTNEVGAVVGRRPYCHQGLWADFNNDGFLDLLEIGSLSDGLSASNRLFYGRSDHTFDWGTNNSGVNTPVVGSWQCALVDYDNDGAVDVFHTTGWTSYNSRGSLYRNQGNGTFTQAWSATGQVFNNQYACWADYDNDGDRDLWLLGASSDWNTTVGQFYRNDGNGSFTELMDPDFPSAQGISGVWGDYDNDGYLDFLLGNTLLHNDHGTGFTTITTDLSGVGYNTTPGARWVDLDNDGDLDVAFITIGGRPGFFMCNEGSGDFSAVDLGSPSHDVPANEFAGSWADYNNDGFMDLFVATRGYTSGTNFLYQNSGLAGGNSNHWLIVKLKGTASNASAIGAKVRVLATIRGGVTWQLREISGSYYDDLRAHFGLGNATNAVTVRIEWPSGTVQELKNVAADQILEVIEPRRPVLAVAVTPTLVTGTLTGDTNQVYQVQMSDDLAVGWTVLTNVTTDASGQGNWLDSGVAPQGRRFYKAVRSP
jgi:enediyne biosynthesis protein E4